MDVQQLVRLLRRQLLIERLENRVVLRRFDKRLAVCFIKTFGACIFLLLAADGLAHTDDAITALGKLEDLYEQCLSELEDAKAGLDECRENGFQDDLAYGELMVTKLGLTQLTKQFDIATGYAEPDPEPYQYQPKTDKPAQ